MTVRRLWPRLAAPLIIAGALACFAFQWIVVSVDSRTARATGLELVRDQASYRGSYVHFSWRGEVEGVIHDAHLWAVIAFAILLVALVLVLLPWRPAWWAGLSVSALALVFLVLWIQATSTVYHPPYVERGNAFWVAVALVPLVAVPILARLREPVSDPSLRQPPEWLARTRREA